MLTPPPPDTKNDIFGINILLLHLHIFANQLFNQLFKLLVKKVLIWCLLQKLFFTYGVRGSAEGCVFISFKYTNAVRVRARDAEEPYRGHARAHSGGTRRLLV